MFGRCSVRRSFACVVAALAGLGTFGALGAKVRLCPDPSTQYVDTQNPYYTSYACARCPPTQASVGSGLYSTPCSCGRYSTRLFRRTYAGFYNGSGAFFDTASLLGTTASTNIDFLYPKTAHNLSMRLSGFIRAPKTAPNVNGGVWNFSLTSTGLSSLQINGTEVAALSASGGVVVALVALRKTVTQYIEVLFGTSGRGGSVTVGYAEPGDSSYHTITWNPLLTCGSSNDCPPGSILVAETVCHPCRAGTFPNSNQTRCITPGGKARCPGPNYAVDPSIGGYCEECDTAVNNYKATAQKCIPCGSSIGFPACINGTPCTVANSYVGVAHGVDTCLYCDPNYFNLDAASSDPATRCVACGGSAQPACQNAINRFVRRVYVGFFADQLDFFGTTKEWAPPSLVTTVVDPTDVVGFTSAAFSVRLHGFFQVPVSGDWQFDFRSAGPLYIIVNGTVAVNFTTADSFAANNAEMNVTVSLDQNKVYYIEVYYGGVYYAQAEVYMKLNAPDGVCYSPTGSAFGCNPALSSGPQFDWRYLLTSGRGSDCPAGSILEPTQSIPDIVCAACPAGKSPNAARSACV